MQEERKVFKANPLIQALLVVFVYLITIYAKHEVLITEDMLFQEFKGEDFESYLEAMNDFRVIKYVFSSLFFMASIIVTFGLLFFGVSIFGLNLRASVIFNVAVLASTSEIIKECFIFFWFKAKQSFVSSEVFNFYPLSVFSLINDQDTTFLFSYITKSIDFFLFLKVVIMIGYLKYLSVSSIEESAKIVLASYLVPLFTFYTLCYVFL